MTPREKWIHPSDKSSKKLCCVVRQGKLGGVLSIVPMRLVGMIGRFASRRATIACLVLWIMLLWREWRHGRHVMRLVRVHWVWIASRRAHRV